jgi:hypothetical protein
MKYILCYPTRDSREVYQKRFTERGNTEEFLNVFIDGWDYFMDHLESDQYGFHVVMQPGQFLEDVIDQRVKEGLSL